MNTVIHELETNPQISRFYEAVIKTRINELLEGEGPWTVLAPYNPAFQGIDITASQEFVQMVKYHIISGNCSVEQMADGATFMTILGKPVTIQNKGSILVNGTPLIRQNTLCSNGIVHMIGKVLIPE